MVDGLCVCENEGRKPETWGRVLDARSALLETTRSVGRWMRIECGGEERGAGGRWEKEKEGRRQL